MATKRKTQSTSKSTTTAKRGGSKASANSSTKKGSSNTKESNANNSTKWSILLFGIGILLLALTYIEGNTGWEWIRQNIVFGIFGISAHLIAPIIITIAVFVAMKKPVTLLTCKFLLLTVLFAGALLVFSSIDLSDKNLFESIAYLHSASTGEWGHGPGVIGVVFGLPMVALIGRPGANIIIVIMLITAVMFATNKTPGDIFVFFYGIAQKFSSEHKERSKSKAERTAIIKQEKINEREANKLEQIHKQNEAEHVQAINIANKSNSPIDNRAFAAIKAGKDAQIMTQSGERGSVDIDLGPDNVTTKLVNAPGEIKIGPGGTFGMNAAQRTNSPSDFVQRDAQYGTIISRGSNNVGKIQAQSTAVQSMANTAATVQNSASRTINSAQQSTTPQTAKSSINASGSQDAQEVPQAQNSEAQTQSDIAMLAMKAASPKEIETVTAELVSNTDSEGYAFPPINLFKKQPPEDESDIQAELTNKAEILVKTLSSFSVQTKILDMSRGPSVTRYELQPLAGVKISRITSLSDDIALNLATTSVRIEAPVPGKAAVGIEVPNAIRSMVSFRSILESPEFATQTDPLTFVIGKDIGGNAVVGNLSKMPHLLIAGTTGSGKSVCTNCIIMSLLYRCSPKMLRLMLIDPKMVEFAQYNGIPHLLMPVVTEPRKAAGALGSAVAEMEKRYLMLAQNSVKNIEEYNELAEEDETMEPMPYIVIVIDEFADLMMVADKEVEDYICRIAQKARAAGMHIIAATQRPSVNFVTGRIKTNIPSRISLSVMSQIDSRTILDTGGAEKLLGNGDLLYMPVGKNKPIRVQGAYIATAEIRSVINYLNKNSTTDYDETMIAEMEKCTIPEKSTQDGDVDESRDSMFGACVEVVIDAGMASTSLLQRRCKLGYARAARIIDEMEQAGIIGPYEGAKPRPILISRQQWIEMTMNKPELQSAST